jgi:hypothetical protein
VRTSERMELAAHALAAALSTPGVVAAHAGPNASAVTAHPSGPLRGVVVAAMAGGRYTVNLYLIARPVPLHALGDAVRARIERRLRATGLADLLGPVSVRFEDVAEEGA